VSADIGQAQDYTAITILDRQARMSAAVADTPTTPTWVQPEVRRVQTEYQLRHIERLPINTPYTEQANRLQQIMTRRELQFDGTLVVDSTGVGAPVLDLLLERKLAPVAITITSGDAVGRSERGYRVPKRELVAAVQVLFESGRIRIARNLELAETLVNELQNFRMSYTASGRDTYANSGEAEHDDLVMSLAMAAWYGRETDPYRTGEEFDTAVNEPADYDPLSW
jgi:hypothetical protein